MKKILGIVLLGSLLLSGCDKLVVDELTYLHSQIDELNARLDELCKETNDNIASLTTIVNAVEDNDYVENVTAIYDKGVVIGYELTFSKHGKVTVYNGVDGKDGKDGADGIVPTIGVRQDIDGIWYWVMDGKWLLDKDGNKVKASATDGKDGADGEDGKNGRDGVTPQLKINDGYWFISYDKGMTWTKLGKATGHDGADGADAAAPESIFSDIIVDDTAITFKLIDGQVITISRNRELKISFEELSGISCQPGKTVRISYTISGADNKTSVQCLAEQGWTAKVEATDTQSGRICVAAPDPMTDSKVLVFVNAGDGRTYMSCLTFVQGRPMLDESTYYIGWQGGSLKVNVRHREELTVKMPPTVNWLSFVPETKAAEKESVLEFTVGKNPAMAERTAKVELVNQYGETEETFIICQRANINGGIVFKDPLVEQICLANFDADKDGYLTVEEAAAVTSIGSKFRFQQDIISFDELRYFTGLETLGREAFYQSRNLSYITLPETIKSIGEHCFYDCRMLRSIALPENIETIGYACFSHCSQLESMDIPSKVQKLEGNTFESCSLLRSVKMPSSVTSIGERCFQGCTSLERIDIPAGVVQINRCTFYECTSLKEVTMGDYITRISSEAFYNCESLKKIALSSALQVIEGNTFRYCSSLERIDIPEKVTTIGGRVFDNCTSLEAINLPESIKSIDNGAFCNCRSLKTIIIPSKIAEFKTDLFAGCTSLERIDIPENVSTISGSAFKGCKSLSEVISRPIIPPTISAEGLFTDANASIEIKVLPTSLESYKAAKYWSDYADKIIMIN